jgi:hypothetical protein
MKELVKTRWARINFGSGYRRTHKNKNGVEKNDYPPENPATHVFPEK